MSTEALVCSISEATALNIGPRLFICVAKISDTHLKAILIFGRENFVTYVRIK